MDLIVIGIIQKCGETFGSISGFIAVDSLQQMSKSSQHEGNSIEHDPVWRLLENAQSHSAGPRFVDDVLRLARLDADRPQPWWARWFAPVPATAFAGLAAAVVVGFFALRPAPDTPSGPAPVVMGSSESKEARIAHIQEVLETEMLFVAVEHLDAFSDEELVALMGF